MTLHNASDDDAEEARLRALYRYDVLDTPPEESFDRLTRIARLMLQVPTVMVTLVDRDRQWVKSMHGVPRLSEIPRELSFCTHTIRIRTPFFIRDARFDPRFAQNPFVDTDPGIRFYLGVPLRTPDGHNIGALCALDETVRDASGEQIAMLEDLGRLVIDELELRQIATTDSLTGMKSRRGFVREAEQVLALGARYGHPTSCIAIDADHFKSVNDRFGHAVGDRVLTAIADACRESLRAVDLLGRMGGEEFAVLLPETSLQGAQMTAERIRLAIERMQIPLPPGVGSTPYLQITASFGVSSIPPSADLAAMLHAADVALYRAKTDGRNRVVVHAMAHSDEADGLLSGRNKIGDIFSVWSCGTCWAATLCCKKHGIRSN